MPSRQKVLLWLRISSCALVLLYIYNIHIINDKSRAIQTLLAKEDTSFWAPAVPATAALSRVSLVTCTTRSCLSTVFGYYLSTSLLWSAIIICSSKSKRNRQHYLLVSIIIASVAIFSLWPSRHCKYTIDNLDGGIRKNKQHIIATKTDGTSLNGNKIRISFSLHDPDDVPYPDMFSKKNYRCGDRPALPPSLGKRTVLNFTTSIQTDLKIVFMGDSIGAQYAQAFEAAALGKGNEGRRWTQSYRYIPEKDWVTECMSIASPVQGGGVSAFWRITGMMSMGNKKSSVYYCDRDHHGDKGWADGQALMLLDHSIGNSTNTEIMNHKQPATIAAFDAFVMRVPHGWLSIPQITKEAIIEEITLINKYLNAETVIISSLPLSNNVVTSSDWKGIGKINHMIHDIAMNWVAPPPGEKGVRTVLVQEFGNFTSQIIWSNAKHIGMYNKSSMPDFSRQGWEQKGDFLFDRLSINGKWPPSKAQVCANRNFWFDGNKDEQCHLNRISVDGSHWCINSLGPRHSASIACLLGCVYNGGNDKAMEDVRVCEQRCNDQFMSVRPVDEEWIGSGTTLFAT